MAFQLIHGDCLEMIRDLPTDSIDLTFTSPPYTDQRTYGIGFKLSGQGWVDWCIPRIIEMCRVTNGLVFFNAAGPVKQFQYQTVMEWLVADLTRLHGIVCGPAPYVFHRVGIPGSGGPHYHRRDWEPVYAFAKPASLPPKWSDNTATGHPPKWAPGGEMSSRKKDGSRVNQCGHSLDSGATNVDEGGVVRSGGKRPSYRSALGFMHPAGGNKEKKDDTPRPSHKGRGAATSGHKEGDTKTEEGYDAPAIANSGNKIMQTYTATEVQKLLGEANDIRLLKVGGGQMGSDLAHDNEAPFPEELPRFFIVSFCPPGGTVLDPMAGSGTVISVAVQEGRNAIGCDIRESQIELMRKRLTSVTPKSLFG